MKSYLKPELDTSTLASWEGTPSHDTVLLRGSSPNFSQVRAHGREPVLSSVEGPLQTTTQSQIDSLVSGFIHQASDWKSVAAMTGGGLAYRWGKISIMGVGAIRESPLLARPLAITFGLASEVTAFEFTHRILQSISVRAGLKPAPTNQLWAWGGPGGWKEGWLTSFVTFGTIKGLGKISQGQNLILQHGFQDTGMVLGHNLVYRAGIGQRPEGTLAEQFVHAEATNIQIGAGMALGHAITGGRILAIERGLDLSIRKIPPTPLFQRGASGPTPLSQRGARGDFALATAEKTRAPTHSDLLQPILNAMKRDRGGSPPETPLRSKSQERAWKKYETLRKKLGGYIYSFEEIRTGLSAVKALLPELSEADRVEALTQIHSLQGRTHFHMETENIFNIIVEGSASLGSSQRITLLEALEAELNAKPRYIGYLVRTIGEIIPQLEAQDRPHWAERLIGKKDDAGNYDRPRLDQTYKWAVPHLPEPARLLLSLQIAETVSSNIFVLPSLSEPQRLTLALKVEESYQHHNPERRQNALLAMRNIYPTLNPADQQARVEEVVKQLGDEAILVNREALKMVLHIWKALTDTKQLEIAKKILERIPTRKGDALTYYLDELGYAFSKPSPQETQLLSDQIKEWLSDERWPYRRIAIILFGKMADRLGTTAAHDLAQKIEARLEDEQLEVRSEAAWVLGGVMGTLPEASRLPLAMKIVEKWMKDLHPHAGYYGAFERAFPHVPEHLRPLLSQALEANLNHETQKIAKEVAESLMKTSAFLPLRELLDRMHQLEEKSTEGNQEQARDAITELKKLIPTLPFSGKIRFLEAWVERRELHQLDLDLLALLIDRLPPELLLDYAARSPSEPLKILADFHAARLFFHESLWKDYLQAKDPKAYLEATSAKVMNFRRGNPLPEWVSSELLLMYAGLDSPVGLSFKEFSQKIRPDLPPLFLFRPFQAPVLGRRSIHRLVDKGKLSQAYAPLTTLWSSSSLERALEDLKKSSPKTFERNQPALLRLKEILEEKAPRLEALQEAFKALVPLFWFFKKSPSMQNFVTRFVLFLSWNRPGMDVLRMRIQNLQFDRNSSDSLGQALKALEEFFQDTVEDTARDLGFPAEELVFVKKQRRHLRREVEKAQGEREHPILVEFLPSQSQADRFFGYVGEDCTKDKGDSIDREDFQVYRMIAGGRLVGMIYLQKFKHGWFKKSLVMAIQPRSSWEVDQTHLLKTIEEHFSQIAKEEGYGFLLLMNNRGQQSNRQDLLAAIEKENYPSIELSEIKGAVFKGDQFLVLWRKGDPIRPAPVIQPPPKPSPEKIEEVEELGEMNLLATGDIDTPPEVVRVADTENDPVEVIPSNALPSYLRTSSIPPREPLRVLLEERPDPRILTGFQHLVFNMMAEAKRNLPVRTQRRMMQAMREGLLEEIHRAFEEAGVPAPFGLGGLGVAGGQATPSQGLMKIPPAQLTRYGALIVNPNELLPPDALVIRRRSLEALLSDPRLTRTDRGWFEPNLLGKTIDELSVQDLFDFYNVVFHQGYQFRGYLRLLQNRGADIGPLAEIVEGLSQNLDQGLHHLFSRRSQEALGVLQVVDGQVTQFQNEMRRIAHTVGLEIDPRTGMIYPRGRQ